MKSLKDLDHLLETMDIAVHEFVATELDAERCFVSPRSGSIVVHYVMGGTTRLAMTGREPVLCGVGAIILGPPGMETRLAPVGDGEPPLIATGIVSARLSMSFGLLDGSKAPIVEDMSGAPIVAQTCALILAEIDNVERRLGARPLVNALMKAAILMVLRRFFKRPGVDQKIVSALVDPRLAGPVAEIIDRAAAPHSVASLAARACLSPSTFARHFKATLGMGPMEFVARARLHRAAELLRSTEMPVKVVAAKVGFASRSHFSKAFSTLHGRDPSTFRDEEGATKVQATPVNYQRLAPPRRSKAG